MLRREAHPPRRTHRHRQTDIHTPTSRETGKLARSETDKEKTNSQDPAPVAENYDGVPVVALLCSCLHDGSSPRYLRPDLLSFRRPPSRFGRSNNSSPEGEMCFWLPPRGPRSGALPRTRHFTTGLAPEQVPQAAGCSDMNNSRTHLQRTTAAISVEMIPSFEAIINRGSPFGEDEHPQPVGGRQDMAQHRQKFGDFFRTIVYVVFVEGIVGFCMDLNMSILFVRILQCFVLLRIIIMGSLSRSHQRHASADTPMLMLLLLTNVPVVLSHLISSSSSRKRGLLINFLDQDITYSFWDILAIDAIVLTLQLFLIAAKKSVDAGPDARATVSARGRHSRRERANANANAHHRDQELAVMEENRGEGGEGSSSQEGGDVDDTEERGSLFGGEPEDELGFDGDYLPQDDERRHLLRGN